MIYGSDLVNSAVSAKIVKTVAQDLANHEEQANSAKALNYGNYINTGDSARDAQALGNTAIQRAYNDAMAAGINPTWYLTQGGSLAGASSAVAIGSQGDKEQRKINQQVADAQTLTSKANMINALANSAKAISSFIRK